MRLLTSLYERIFGRPAPRNIRDNSLFLAIWRPLRKTLNVCIIPFIPFNAVRLMLYRLVGFKIGKRVFIGMQCYLDDYAPHLMVVEDEVTISYRVTFACHGPRTNSPKLVLREGCYIGTCATILGGIEIGPYASVGASALVNRSVPPLATVAGVPARIIRRNRTPWGGDNHRLAELMDRYQVTDRAESSGPSSNLPQPGPSIPPRHPPAES